VRPPASESAPAASQNQIEPRQRERDEAARRLFRRYRDTGDLRARDALASEFLPLAKHLARRYGRDNSQAEDLVQVASLGLLKAIDRFDPDRGIAFSSFAAPTILGELKRYFRDKSWTVRVPRDLQELWLKVARAADELERELGRAPTAGQVAERVGVTVEQVLDARVAASARTGVSLDRPGGDGDDEGASLGETFGVADRALELAEDAVTVERLMTVLSERDRLALRLRFADDLTQAEIGQRLGISQMHVSRVIRQAITQLQAAAGEAPSPSVGRSRARSAPRRPADAP
jgi:RNA polymerase sigma-B factor